MGEDDAKLIARVAGGDLGHPLEELYDRYAARLHGLGLRLLGDPGLAEELVQETFVRLWQSAGRYDPQRGSVASFVFTIARRLVIDLRRRPSSRPFAELAADQGPERDPGDAVDQLLVGLNVRDALDSLPDGQREVLELPQRVSLGTFTTGSDGSAHLTAFTAARPTASRWWAWPWSQWTATRPGPARGCWPLAHLAEPPGPLSPYP
jgi:RNA polymerase sigma-70 factor (ECF subfamily)